MYCSLWLNILYTVLPFLLNFDQSQQEEQHIAYQQIQSYQGFNLNPPHPFLEPVPPPSPKFSTAWPLSSSEFCLGLFNIACFFTKVSHKLVQTTSYILKPHAYREAYGVSLSRQDHAPFPPLLTDYPPLCPPPKGGGHSPPIGKSEMKTLLG